MRRFLNRAILLGVFVPMVTIAAVADACGGAVDLIRKWRDWWGET